MLFPTMPFAIFFLVIYVTVGSLERENGRRKLFLLLASWFFYAAWDWRFVGLLILSGLINYSAAALIAGAPDARRRKLVLVAGVGANLLILGFFKYFDFFLEQLGALLDLMHWKRDLPLLRIVLPVGISFFTFQGVSYVVDVYRGKCPPARSLLDVMLLMSFFPHLVAGPIVRASDLLPQFAKSPRLDRRMASEGFLMVAWGLFKKTVIASELSTGLVDPVFFDPASHGAVDLVAATYGYAAQIYCDFSAYSDIAIGVAALLGYRFPRNFDQPYRSTSLQEFWRRWHISLSSWLRDYLFIPLGGSRGGLVMTCRNIMITMLLGGLWHGANLKFLAWGGLHGMGLSAERIWSETKPKSWAPWPAWLGLIVTFHLVCLGWILFRADSFGAAVEVLKGLFRLGEPVQVLTPFLLALTVFGIAIHFLPPRALEAAAGGLKRLPSPMAGAALACAVLVVEAWRPEGVAPFIYFQF
jgi:D-alanyl-lipoteichoic acid acyltransferase DltB (MBOAT superfamily)